MNKEILTFGDIVINEHNFPNSKNAIDTIIVDIDKILISNKVSFCKKEVK